MVRRKLPPPMTPADSADEIEASFYEALAAGDLARLMTLWADDDEIVCVHPGGVRCVGPAAVRASYEQILAGGGLHIVPEQVHRLHTMDSALHHLVERLHADGEPLRVLALNVYVRTPVGWRIAAHHASPVHAQLAAREPDVPATLH